MVRIEQFKDYYLTRRIGIGGMAEIFRGWKIGEEGFEKQVVVKRLLVHLATNDDFRSMFLDEARLASRLTHPNIVHVYDLGRHIDPYSGNPNYFIVMEHVFGKNLAEIRNKAAEKSLALSLEYLVRIVAGAAAALHYAHEKMDDRGQPLHIVHRDVSPQNILISYDGDVKLVDFGIAKALTKTQHTQSGVLKGKLAYMSPEQARGDAIDRRADIYSLGVVFWEFLTGKRLFSGDSEASVLRKVLDPEIASPASLAPQISKELEALCMKCLAPMPEDRYPDALSLAMALESHLRDLTTIPGSYSIRDFMRVLFGPEIENEFLQVQEEIKAVREFVATGAQSETIQTADSDSKITIVASELSSSGRGDKNKSKFSTQFMKRVFSAVAAGSALLLLVLFFILHDTDEKQALESERPPVAAQSQRHIASKGDLERPLGSSTSHAEAIAVDHGVTLDAIEELLDKDDLEEALSRIMEAENGQPWSAPDLQDARAAVVTRMAEKVMESDANQALNHLNEVLKRIPDHAQAHLQVGRALSRLDMNAQALQAYDRAVALDSSLHVAHYNRGILLLQTGNYLEAEQSFLQTLALRPPYLADVLVNLAACRAKAGDMQQAKTYLVKALEVDPEHEIAKKNLERFAQ